MIRTNKKLFNIDLDCKLVEELEREAYALSLTGQSLAAMKKFEKVSRICLPCMKSTNEMACKKNKIQ
ncbi:hypothetical protein CSE45_2582 [Citreicella sp. SE45]|nr:hypothetical protein CSE45_2582 [Citreicella sp. SE45]